MRAAYTRRFVSVVLPIPVCERECLLNVRQSNRVASRASVGGCHAAVGYPALVHAADAFCLRVLERFTAAQKVGQ